MTDAFGSHRGNSNVCFRSHKTKVERIRDSKKAL